MPLSRLLVALFLISTAFAAPPDPKRDLKYDTKHERNTLDFWPAPESDSPAPIFVFFHGGGFRAGDKSHLEERRRTTIDTYQKAGFAIASCNYPFLAQDMDYRDIVIHCARAVQFIRSKAKEWNIDPQKLICGGVSAGALISEALGYHDDFAAPKSSDPISRFSSRPAVIVSIMQPIGTKEFALRYMDKGEAPLFIYTNAKPTDLLHPPDQAILIKDKAEALGIPVAIYSGGRNKIPKVPEGKDWVQLQLEFCLKHFQK